MNVIFNNPRKKVDYKLDKKSTIGLIRLMYRTDRVERIQDILDILKNSGYNESDRDWLNSLRIRAKLSWQDLNGDVIGECVTNMDKLNIIRIYNPFENPYSTKDPDKIARNNTRKLFNSNMFIVTDTVEEKIYIIKSKYF